ncbi:MAG TPA: pectinesterase family protein [Prolixibacteraceae bacterium]|nr:pectinesterase family protein [Prolixibacteraceae bacterium]
MRKNWKADGKTVLFLLLFLSLSVFLSAKPAFGVLPEVTFFPASGALNVNPDTHLELTFPASPVLGAKGQIRVYDAADNRLVDLLDLSIPAGPTTGDTTKNATYTPVPYQYVSGKFTNANTKPGTPSGVALPTSDKYQLTIIGGFTDGFHFYPVIVHGNTATIYLHNNLLEYGKSYYVQIDPGVLSLNDGSFTGIQGKDWSFATKKVVPNLLSNCFVVNADGTGDFNTVQGALDFVPDNNSNRVTIFVKKGVYEEIVYFRNKNNITILGESREGTVVRYANNEVFNPHPVNVKTNEMAGTFPSRRAAFAADHCRGIHLVNMTIETTAKGQAEGLLLNGEENMVSHVTIIGSGDALQTNGSAYFTDCLIVGDGDTVLGRGPAYFNRCELRSYGAFMWIRNTGVNHGNVFVGCKFIAMGEGETEIARCPTNRGKNYPYCEAVLIDCSLSGIIPKGWGEVGGETATIHYWEYNSTNLSDGKPVDTSRRHLASRQLTMEKDSAIVASYRNPSFVLGGWMPDQNLLELYESKIKIMEMERKSEAPVGTILTRLSDGVFVHVNQAYADIHGYRVDEMIGQSVFSLNTWYVPEQRKAVIDELQKNGSFYNMPIKARKKDGIPVDCLLSGELIVMDGVKYCLGLIEKVQ